MACGSCSNRAKQATNTSVEKIFSNYKYLTDRQLNVRIHAYKKRYCSNCEKQQGCDITMFITCKDIK